MPFFRPGKFVQYGIFCQDLGKLVNFVMVSDRRGIWRNWEGQMMDDEGESETLFNLKPFWTWISLVCRLLHLTES